MFWQKNSFISCVLLAYLTVPMPAQACIEQARTELETVYCQIKKKNSALVPGGLREFRQNPDKTQRLLLQRPAKRLGITLPPDKNKRAKQTVVTPEKPQGKTKAEQEAASNLSQCQVSESLIQCPSGLYRLVKNKPIKVLGEAQLHHTRLRCALGKVASAAANRQAISKCYTKYIERMLGIGLAEVTMSYTKFFHLYQEVMKSGGDFSQRLHSMFEFLKKDKATMSSSTRQNKVYRDGIAQCQQLNSSIIVCDNVEHNWVFELTQKRE